MKFTDEKMIEIGEARARLEAWRSSFQFYPALPEESEEPVEVTVKKMSVYVGVDKKALELQERIVALESKVPQGQADRQQRVQHYK